MPQVRHSLLSLVNEWNTDPGQAAQQPLQTISEVKHRISTAVETPTAQRRTTPPHTRGAAYTSFGHSRSDPNPNKMINSQMDRQSIPTRLARFRHGHRAFHRSGPMGRRHICPQAELEQLSGVGPFYSSLIVIRACGHADAPIFDAGFVPRSKAAVPGRPTSASIQSVVPTAKTSRRSSCRTWPRGQSAASQPGTARSSFPISSRASRRLLLNPGVGGARHDPAKAKNASDNGVCSGTLSSSHRHRLGRGAIFDRGLGVRNGGVDQGNRTVRCTDEHAEFGAASHPRLHLSAARISHSRRKRSDCNKRSPDDPCAYDVRLPIPKI